MPDMSIEIVLKKTAGTNHGIQPIPLDAVADKMRWTSMINSEMPCCVSVLFNVRDRDLGSTVEKRRIS
jgi:hypothetical protein